MNKSANQRPLIKYSSVLVIVMCTIATSGQMQKLRIAENDRFLVKEDKTPFVWVGDTNWFFAKLPPTVIDSILDNRREQGFTIMLISCREKLYNGDGPGSLKNPNQKWWSYLDEYIAKCEERNLYVGLTLGWWGLAKRNSAKSLYDFGKWVGNRYKNRNNIVWLTLGEAGSHSRENGIENEKISMLVKGIRDGDTGHKLLTIHADYRRGTSISKDGDICDFNNWQTSQWCCLEDLPRNDERTWTVWETITYDYNKTYNGKHKPTLDSEAWYENNKDFCGTTPFNIRRRAYFTIFAGAFGHTYGAGGIWDGLKLEKGCSNKALDAIHYIGARHMGYLSRFLHNLGDDYLKLHPDQSIIVEGNSDNYDTHIQATKAVDNSFALIYSASDAPYVIDMSKLSKHTLSAIWYDPRNNEYKREHVPVSNKPSHQSFDPPGKSGPGNDWVLILSDKLAVDNFPLQ
ncbi:DUF4038 domain-containing protein [Ulvibacterium sp.]|uniref:apiosidase-like domain-containing protein n=1 Tax=Ulvibacterium sp. TaxID=2665914 RepID=UPI003BA9A095